MFKIETVNTMKVTIDIKKAIREGLINPDDIDDLDHFLKMWPTIDIFGYCKDGENGKKQLELWYQPVDFGHIVFAIGVEVDGNRVKEEYLRWIEVVLANYIHWDEIY